MKAIIDIPKKANDTLGMLKIQMGFKNKSESITFLVNRYQQEILEPRVNPDYAKRILANENKNGKKFKSIEELKRFYS